MYIYGHTHFSPLGKNGEKENGSASSHTLLIRIFLFHLFIYYFQQAAKYACSFMNSLFHSDICVLKETIQILHTCIYNIPKCIILFLYFLNEWLAE